MPIAVFKPEEYVIPIKPLFSGATVIPIRFPIRLENIYGSTMYFKLLVVNPPAGWQTTEAYLGPVSPYGTKWTMVGLSRQTPTLTEGEYSETLTMRIEIYSDENYTNLVDQQNFEYKITYIDPTDPSWIIIDHDSFETGGEGWIGTSEVADPSIGFKHIGLTDKWLQPGMILTSSDSVEGSISLALRSFQVDNLTVRGIVKWYDARWFDRSYIIIHIRGLKTFAVRIDEEVILPASASNQIIGTWTAIAMKAPKKLFKVVISASTIDTNAGEDLAYIDAIYLIAK